MKTWILVAVTAVAGTALFLTGCNCDPESDEELCGEQHCGQTTLVDDCGNERALDCGTCEEGRHCQNQQCVCEPETDQQLCDEADAACGPLTTTDRCGNDRQIECGSCISPDECIDGQCQCMGESDNQLCDQRDLDCGETTIEDACGESRTIDCGSCSDPDECTDNTCECIGESDDELCADHDLGCGEASVEDVCGTTRTVDCGGCSDPNQCVDNACQCVGESDDELCDQATGACGTTQVTDQCGETRTVDCQECPTGDTTFGAIKDGETGELIEGAEIRVYEWPPSGGQDHRWEWSAGYRENDPDMSTTTSDGTDDYNFEFASDGPICLDDQTDGFEAHQWYRFVIEHPDYDPAVFYRPHPGFDDSCPSSCPTGPETGCQRQDFELFRSDSTYTQYPNLVADKRELNEHEFQCVEMPDGADNDRLIGLRVRAGAANLGPGSYHLEGIAADDEVVQHIERSDGSTETRTVDSQFYHHDDHGHTHFMAWFGLALVQPADQCRDVDDRPDSCVAHTGTKISYCLHDLEPFDGDVGQYFDGTMSLFPDPPTCNTNEQGLTPGWNDTYNRHLPGQVMVLGPPDDVSGTDPLWIEAEVDPEQVIEEVERHGNVARIPVEFPDDATSICGDSSRTLDCSMPPEDYETTQQHRQCGDYRDWAGLD